MPDHVGHVISCPFRLCLARVELVIEQAQPDDDELTVERVPIHDLENPRLMRSTCPASLLKFPVLGAGLAHLEAAMRSYHGWIGEATEVAKEKATRPKPEKPRPPRNGWFTQGGSPGPDPRRLNRADDPPPVQRPRLRILGGIGRPDANAHIPEGKGAEVAHSQREQLRALALLAAEGQEQAQALAARINELLTAAGAMSAQLIEKLDACSHLARAAVGGGSMPEQAAKMLAGGDAARSTATDTRDTIVLAGRRAMSAHASSGASAAAARAYARTL